MADIAYRKTIISPREGGWLIGMDEDGQTREFTDPEDAVRFIARRDRRAFARGSSTVTLIEWRDMPDGFQPPEVQP